MTSLDPRRGTVRWSRHRRAVQLVTSLTLLLGGLLSSAYSSPVFPFTSFQASRNLRHLPCVVRNTGEEGICMFAINCFKANGTHLGVCIDKIFFGSCCQVNDDRLVFEPDITDNSIDHNSVTHFQHFPPQTSVMNTHRKPPLTETRLPTTPATNGTHKYELVSSSSPTTSRTTPKTNRRTTTTTARTTKAPLKVQQKDELQTTTEYQEFTTFQYVQSSKNPAVGQGSSMTTNKRPPMRPSSSTVVTEGTRLPSTKTTTQKPYKTRRPTTNKTTTRGPIRRPAVPLTTPTTTATEEPTTTPTLTTRKVVSQGTRQPVQPITTIGSRKPPSTIAAASQTTIASRRPTTTQTSSKPESTTPSVTYSRRPTTSPAFVALTKPNRRRPTPITTTTTTTTSTTISPDTTRAPRPRPKPTSQVATVPATSLDHLIETNSSPSSPPSVGPTRLTYPPTTVKVTQATSPTPTPTPRPGSSSTQKPTTTQSEPTVQSSTVKVPASPVRPSDSEDLATLSRPGLVTWTSILEDTPTERPSGSQVEVSFAQDTKLPIEELLPGAAYVYDTVQEQEDELPGTHTAGLSVHSQVTSPASTEQAILDGLGKTTEGLPVSMHESTTNRHSVVHQSTTTEISKGVPSTTTTSTTTTATTTTRKTTTTTEATGTRSPPIMPGSIAMISEHPSGTTDLASPALSTTVPSSPSEPSSSTQPPSLNFTSSAAPTLTTSSAASATVSEPSSASASSEESGTSTTIADAWSSSSSTTTSPKRPVDTSSTTEAVNIRESTTAQAEESSESAVEGSGEEEEEGSGSEEGTSEEEEGEGEEEEEGEGADESEETTEASTTTTAGPGVSGTADGQHKVTNESLTTGSSPGLPSSTVVPPPSPTGATASSTSTTLQSGGSQTSTLSPTAAMIISGTNVTAPAGGSSPSTLSSSAGTSATTSTPSVTSDRGPAGAEGASTTGMPVKFPEEPAGNLSTTTTMTTTTTLASLANVTTDGVTLAPDFLTTSTLPSLEGIEYRSVCGKRMFPEPRIVGGTKAAFGRWPWQISLRQWRTSTYLHKCGAALLNENWAITAAHCVDNVPPSDLLLRLGEYDLALEEEPYGYQERRVQIVASHPQFDPRTFEYDLALLRFYEPVIFQPNIIPVCVPENDENFIGRTAFVTGWGRLYEDGPLPSVLQEVTVPVIENKICETMYRSAGYIEHIPHIFICAGWKKGGYDSCEGDSGGPMVIQRTDKRFLLAGVISWGIGCAEPNQPGVYTRISEFRDWINQILQF
uniref:Uncharacterized protein n=1 Tax=Anopheles atroparvus TaxID=41427 RepID=A0A182IRY1_ANOAO